MFNLLKQFELIESNIYFKNILVTLKYNLFFQNLRWKNQFFCKRKKYLKNTKNIDHSSFPRIVKSLQKIFSKHSQRKPQKDSSKQEKIF